MKTIATISLTAAALLAGAAAAVAAEPGAAEKPLAVKVTRNTLRLMPYQVFELTFQHEGRYHDPNWDVSIDVVFRSPGGKRIKVGGFFYGSSRPQKPVIKEWKDDRGRTRTSATWPCDPPDLWKARYAPSETGAWTFDYVFRGERGGEAKGSGEFRVVAGRVPQKGWVRINPRNPVRLQFEDGTPFFPIGFQDGIFDSNHNGSAMDTCAMEGPFRLDNKENRPVPPPGALFARGPSMNPRNCDEQFGRHARAGFNLWRFSPNNFSIKVFTLDRVDWQEAAMVDELLRMTRKYGIRNFYGIFGFTPAFNQHAGDAEGMAKVKRIIKYSVDRWGAYADFWEMLNEQKASAEWYAEVVPYLKSIDPYGRPVATSWERPELDVIDCSAPHWYGNEDELSSDRVTADRARRDKRFGKPVIYGEQGNSRGREDRSGEGVGGVWDPGSARRMRVRLWTALFGEIHFVFWETSYAKDGHTMNIWIGPEERQYVRVLQDFARRLDAEVKPVDIEPAGKGAGTVRAYGLRSEKRAAVYLHHFGCAQCDREAKRGGHRRHRWDHDRGRVEGLEIAVDVPEGVRGYWVDPRDASIVKRVEKRIEKRGEPRPGRQRLAVPPFEVDLALLLVPDGPPDADGDGLPNDEDEDDDGDGVPDSRDAFPLEREEWADADRDRIGDNLDADLDGDGVADDRNGNGTADNEEADIDGDGVPTAGAIPWDAFPRDPKEWRDTDGDGIGDGADEDDDGDGWTDQQERRTGTDPLDPLSFPGR